jgi:hypothetical protein
MSEEFDRAAGRLAEARAKYETASHNMAVAAANLKIADRAATAAWKKLTIPPSDVRTGKQS